MKKNIAIALCLVLILFANISCGGRRVTEISATEKINTVLEDKKVGVLMPTKTDERWEQDAKNIQKALEQDGYRVEVCFAENNSCIQTKQMEKMLQDGIDCLVVGQVDTKMMKEVLQKAKAQQVAVISYDRLLMDTDALSYYATFDSKTVGFSIGTYIKEKVKLDELRKQKQHRTIEFFMGTSDDNNARLIYEGVMEVLGEYLKDGTLVCNSERIQFDVNYIWHWSGTLAEKNAFQILNQYYKEEKLDIACCASDTIAAGVISSLEQKGYSEEEWPLITGQDAGVKAVKNIISGKQAMTVYKDTRILADKCAGMVRAVLEGTKPEINCKEVYNGRVNVPSYLCTTVVVDRDNYKEILVDGGYYTESQLE